jgi:hypothetical protein
MQFVSSTGVHVVDNLIKVKAVDNEIVATAPED